MSILVLTVRTFLVAALRQHVQVDVLFDQGVNCLKGFIKLGLFHVLCVVMHVSFPAVQPREVFDLDVCPLLRQ